MEVGKALGSILSLFRGSAIRPRSENNQRIHQLHTAVDARAGAGDVVQYHGILPQRHQPHLVEHVLIDVETEERKDIGMVELLPDS